MSDEGQQNTRISLGRLQMDFRQGKRADEASFAEMRSSLLLYTGKHGREIRGRDSNVPRELASYSGRAENVTLKFTRNQIPRIADVYVNEILRQSPDIAVIPKDGGDVKANRLAKLNFRVYEEHKKKTAGYRYLREEEVLRFVVEGEVACKLYWDAEKEWVREEPISSYNLIRSPGAESIESAEWLGQETIYTKQKFKEMFGEHTGVDTNVEGGGLNFSEEGTKDFVVFDSRDREYRELKGVAVREVYYRPCRRYPQGYYFHFTEERILDHGPLPGGIFPIVTGRCFMTPGLARGHSFVRQAYQYQIEINRASGQDATNMVQFGSDKLLTSSNSNVSLGDNFEGVTHLKVSGFQARLQDAIFHMVGTGVPKFMEYITSLIKELDYNLNILSAMEERKQPRSGDVSFVLYSSIKDKQRFSSISRRYEAYCKEKAETTLRLLRHYLTAEDLIHDGNREDAVLIDEFKSTSNEDYTFDVQIANETPETMLGKQLMIQQVLQYTGQSLTRDDIGLLIRNSTLGNIHELASNFTTAYDAVVQNIVLLEKGVFPRITPTEDFKYKAEKITQRMNRPDFHYLDPRVQRLFGEFLRLCEEQIARQNEEKMKAEAGMIPVSGDPIRVDIWSQIRGPKGGYRRVAIPRDALNWLMKMLEKQGTMVEQLEGLSDLSQARILNEMKGGGGSPVTAGLLGSVTGGENV